MNAFARVMHPNEAKQIVKDGGKTPTNKDACDPYKQGSVVSLFQQRVFRVEY